MAEHISNDEFLENYLQFAVFHRWRVAEACLARLAEFGEEAPERDSLALEITTNLFFTVEDILMWFHVLKAWNPSDQSQNLMDMLDALRLNPASRQAVLDALRSMSRSAFRTLLKVPNNAQERSRAGISPASWKRFKRNAESLQDNLVEFLANLEAKRENLEDGWLIRCLNKVKHGLIVMKETPEGHPAVGIYFGGSLPTSEDGKTRRLYCPTATGDNEYMVSQVRLGGKLLAGILAPPFQVVFRREPNVDWPPGWAAS